MLPFSRSPEQEILLLIFRKSGGGMDLYSPILRLNFNNVGNLWPSVIFMSPGMGQFNFLLGRAGFARGVLVTFKKGLGRESGGRRRKKEA